MHADRECLAGNDRGGGKRTTGGSACRVGGAERADAGRIDALRLHDSEQLDAERLVQRLLELHLLEFEFMQSVVAAIVFVPLLQLRDERARLPESLGECGSALVRTPRVVGGGSFGDFLRDHL